MSKKFLLVVMLTVLTGWVYGQVRITPAENQPARAMQQPHEGKDIKLEHPEEGGMPFMEVLKMRKSTRKFNGKPLEMRELSGLLWAANGINRPEENKRTAPSARNASAMEIYVVMENGIYLYLPKEHRLKFITEGDHRQECVAQNSFAATASVILVMVANAEKMNKHFKPEEQDRYAAFDCGYISQNIYLYAASQHLSTVAMGQFENEAIRKILKLKNDKIVLIQPVGSSE